MPWTLPSPDYTQFQRNPLVAVIAQLRFHPVMKIDRGPADFQEEVRPNFPRSAKRSAAKHVELRPDGVNIVEQNHFQFVSLDNQRTLELSSDALTLTNRAHSSRAEFKRDFSLAVTALENAHSPILPTRLGLRYVNRIYPTQVSAFIGRSVKWEDVVQPDYLHGPPHFSIDGTARFVSEFLSTNADGMGGMLVRYGILNEQNETEPHFRLDVDRYFEGDFQVKDAPEMIEDFAADIFTIFRSLAGSALLEWMTTDSGSSHSEGET